jgi:transcriptional regulator with XRE-family HTH domain
LQTKDVRVPIVSLDWRLVMRIPKQIAREFGDVDLTGHSRRAGSIDVLIGQRIRTGRVERHLSQEALAGLIGVSCQQLQKYEVGANRISVARLLAIATALDMNATHLLQSESPITAAPKAAAGATGQELLRLMNAYCRIANDDSRNKIVEMAEFLAGLEEGAPSASR